MMKPKDIAIAILSKRKPEDDKEGADKSLSASNILSAIEDEDPEALAAALEDFVSMCED